MFIFQAKSFTSSELKAHQAALGVPQLFILEKCLLALELTGIIILTGSATFFYSVMDGNRRPDCP